MTLCIAYPHKRPQVNFSHERLMFCLQSNRYARIMLEDAVKFARMRKTFGKRLADHQVIRHKIAEMSRHIEATHALLEQICYQFNTGVK